MFINSFLEQKKGFTLAIIKPNVVAAGKVDEILDKVSNVLLLCT